MIDLRLGDCLEILPTLPNGCVDAIIADPPYPCIDRDYGQMTEAEWHAMMRGVVAQSRRVLKPTGSAVFILQPNSRKAGSMRPWLFEFQAWTCREWNMVQDVWWWNTNAMPSGGAPHMGLLRGSAKACVWLGEPDCYRDQASVLIPPTWNTRYLSSLWNGRTDETRSPSGRRIVPGRTATSWKLRGGVIPFNVLPFGNSGNGKSKKNAGSYGHSAGTPQALCDWWTRYICPPGGTICDPFMGSGTTGLSALKYSCDYIGIEKMANYLEIAERRIATELDKTALFA